jgi:hypothetical protein
MRRRMRGPVPSKNMNDIPYKQKYNTNATPWISLSQEDLIPKAMTSLLIPHPKTYKETCKRKEVKNAGGGFCCCVRIPFLLVDLFSLTFKSFQFLHSRSNLSQNFVHGFRRRQNARSEWLHHMSKRQCSNASLEKSRSVYRSQMW